MVQILMFLFNNKQKIRFKDMSPFCAQAGLYLASGPFSANIRHFGLQLMEHTVKFKWNCISQEEKIFIKVSAQPRVESYSFDFNISVQNI